MKLAIITSHPIQYYAPWFRYMNAMHGIDLRVFYLWDFGVKNTIDPEFKSAVQWDIPLLDGYSYEFVPNKSADPGTHHFGGLNNPGLAAAVRAFQPDAVLMMIYNYRACIDFILKWNTRRAPLLFRGDSHRLVKRHGIKETFRRRAISALYNRFQALLYVGKANREYYRYHRAPEEKLFFAPHAVDNNRFIHQADTAQSQARQWREELGVPDDHKLVLFAGKFIEKKRPNDLLRAFIRIDSPDTHLLLVGGGELEKKLREIAGQHPRVHFAPFQNQSKMPRTYAAADLVVLPSFGLGETWGLAINEAMCLARAVMASSHVGCGLDLINNARNGFIFEAGDQEDLTRKLARAIQSKDRLAAMGAESRRIIENYSYAQTTDGLKKALGYLGAYGPKTATQTKQQPQAAPEAGLK